MISFFYHRKGNLNTCEDSLTAVVFDTLKYLPTDLFWSILKQALYFDKLPTVSGELLSISFWEKWSANDTSNSNFVEPDVFLRFQEFDILIEAKRYNEKQQSRTQLENEIQAYFNEYSDDNKKLYFIQLGGLQHRNDEPDYLIYDKNVVICKTNWTKLLDEIVALNNRIKGSNLAMLKAYSRVLDDAINGFELHQYYKKKWLKDITVYSPIQYQSLKELFPYAKQH